MLVLSRKVREQIRLPGLDVVVTVLEVRGGKVRLGITAPDDIAVVREGLWRQMQQLGDRDSRRQNNVAERAARSVSRALECRREGRGDSEPVINVPKLLANREWR